ncbi:MAG: hypothetical protein ACU0BF_06985 [Paracoccaceae bacterium]
MSTRKPAPDTVAADHAEEPRLRPLADLGDGGNEEVARPTSDVATVDTTPERTSGSQAADRRRARIATAEGKMPGTTHDPNSITTNTDQEPDGDVYPPKDTYPRTEAEDRAVRKP